MSHGSDTKDAGGCPPLCQGQRALLSALLGSSKDIDVGIIQGNRRVVRPPIWPGLPLLSSNTVVCLCSLKPVTVNHALSIHGVVKKSLCSSTILLNSHSSATSPHHEGHPIPRVYSVLIPGLALYREERGSVGWHRLGCCSCTLLRRTRMNQIVLP